MVRGSLGGEHHPPDLAAVAAVLEDLLADQLALAVAVGGEPDPLCALERVADGLELGGLVAACGGLGAVEPVGAQQHGRPTLPGRHRLFGLEQRQQVAFGREDGAEARAHGGADVLGLAGLLGDDDVVGHRRSGGGGPVVTRPGGTWAARPCAAAHRLRSGRPSAPQQEGDLRRRPGQGQRDEADAASFLHRARPRPRRRAARHRRTSPGAARHADPCRPWRDDEIAVGPSEMAHGRMRTKNERGRKRPAPL